MVAVPIPKNTAHTPLFFSGDPIYTCWFCTPPVLGVQSRMLWNVCATPHSIRPGNFEPSGVLSMTIWRRLVRPCWFWVVPAAFQTLPCSLRTSEVMMGKVYRSSRVRLSCMCLLGSYSQHWWRLLRRCASKPNNLVHALRVRCGILMETVCPVYG